MREGSVSWDGGQVHIGHVTNTPVNFICCTILTPEGDVEMFYTHKGQLGGSE